MVQSVYKGRFGWSESDEKHPGTHKLLSNEEYAQMETQLKDALSQLKEQETTHQSELKRVIEEVQEDIQDAKLMTEEQVAVIQKKLDKAEAEKEYQTSLNTNLIRICKERANADRKLKPKKEHTGYVVMSSQEKEIRYRKEKNVLTDVVWETVLQSPYSIEFTEREARKLIKDELLPEEKRWKLSEIGIVAYFMTDYAVVMEKYPKEIKKENTAFNERLRANYKAGYWEYIVLHTLPLGPVPKDMLP